MTHKYFPLLHSLDVLSLTFLIIFLFIDISAPFCNSHPPTDHKTSSTPPLPTIPCSVCHALNNLPAHTLYSIIEKRNPLQPALYSSNFVVSLLLLLSGDIQLNPGPTSTTLEFAHLNICSASSVTTSFDKPTLLQEFISDQNIDIIALSETWLAPNTLPSTLNSLTPENFTLTHNPRPVGRGGGLALIYRSYLSSSRITTPSSTSFESLCVRLSIRSSSIIFLIIYRPPSSSIPMFISEFSTLLDDLNCSPSELIISGDFNIHVDDTSDPLAHSFLETLDSYHLTQHVRFPTHKLGHTLDLLITKSASNISSSPEYTIPFISDHYALHSTITLPAHSRPPRSTKTLRSFKSVDPIAFSADIFNSAIYSPCPPDTLTSYTTLFSSTLSTIIDKHAPLKTISFPSKPKKPFITPAILEQKKIRSRLESVYRRTRSPLDLLNFKTQARYLAKLITTSRRTFYRTLITQNQYNPRHLWSTLNALLSRKIPQSLPSGFSLPELSSNFLKFFENKISRLTANLPAVTGISPHISPPHLPPTLDSFTPATLDEVRNAILASSDSTCDLDTIPTKLLKSCLDSLLHPITNIINMSFAEGSFPDQYKHALVSPRLKKYNLPKEDMSSYRPISNLNFVSKIIERLIHTRIFNHLNSFSSITPFQSAYRPFHSVETALLYIQNDLLLAANEQKLSALILLDLSAAFDTIDHQILLTRLSSFYGISGSALSLLASYLTDRTQSVCVNSTTTAPSQMPTGVPQGSVLGPLLFTLYTSPLSQLFTDSHVSFHLYADDTQMYLSFSAADSEPALSTLSFKLDTIHTWLTSNRLTVNPSKTEYLIIGTPQQRSKLPSTTIYFQNTPIIPSSSARNLGFVFDSGLSHKKQISSVCQSSYLYIRQLRQIRSVLDTNTATVLANSLISSRLDYCNSLYYNLPDSSITRLQRIQNSLARVVLPSTKRHDHITPALRKLHWLPVKQRITFKIATLTFKTLHHGQPTYLSNLITRHNPVRSLRSSSQSLLRVPVIKSEIGRRSFSFAAPTVWNSLPPSLRTTTSLSSFRSSLKTHLFPP